MENLKEYLKYYFLEDYLFEEISKNFLVRNLTAEEFFAIVIWKRNASKTKIKEGLKKRKLSVAEVSTHLKDSKDNKERLDYLDNIPGIGVSIASAIVAVCYPKIFTVADYRAFNSLIRLLDEEKFSDVKEKFPALIEYKKKYLLKHEKKRDINDMKSPIYFEYLGACKELAKRLKLSLRNFDRVLWGMDFYDGKNGLRDLARDL